MIKLNEKRSELSRSINCFRSGSNCCFRRWQLQRFTSVNNADFSKYQNLATNYAQQGLEVMRTASSIKLGLFCKPGSSVFFRIFRRNILFESNYSLALSPVNSLGVCDPTPNVVDNGKSFFLREVTLTQNRPFGS